LYKVLRGGAFNINPSHVRCAYRDWFIPNSRDANYGFRVVVSPSL
jgi:formylglycine-generating enzyme required for sulfatase activity